MTYVFDMSLHLVQIPAEMREWEDRFPIPGPESKRALAAVGAWRDGDGTNRAEDMPKVLLDERARKSWPVAFETNNGLHFVSGRAKDVIEALDPGIHQFFPLSLQTKRGIEIEGPWFAMNVHAKQDSVVLEKSSYQKLDHRPDELNSFYLGSRTRTKDIVVDPARHSRLNLWREQRFVGSLLGSDELVEQIKAQKLKFFRAFKVTDLNVSQYQAKHPWRPPAPRSWRGALSPGLR